MANTFDRVSLTIMSLKDFQDAELAYSVIKKINEYGKDFIPNVYDLYQPLKRKYENGFQRFKNLCNDLILLLEPVHGEIVNLSFPGWEVPINLRVRHPEINWMVFFGRPYIDLFGREKLLSTPCHSVHTIGDNVIALQLIDSLFEPVPPSIRSTVKRHLGEDAFVENGKSYRAYNTGKVPEFDFSGVLFNKT